MILDGARFGGFFQFENIVYEVEKGIFADYNTSVVHRIKFRVVGRTCPCQRRKDP